MVAGVSNLYNISSSIQSNATLNRALMEIGGCEVPFTIMANNKDERIERAYRGALFVLTAFVAPVVTMPIFNKFFSKRDGIVKNDKEIAILRVSKEYLTGNADKMTEGFKKTAEILKKGKNKEKFTDIDKHFNNVLERFPNKEILRQKLAKTHSKIFLADFLVASLAAISVPWISNFITEKRTKRAGYVGEFEIADSKYTDKMTEKHESLKKKKLAIAFASPVLASLGFTKLHLDSMIKPVEKLGYLGKLVKKNIGKFDYKNAIFMGKTAYFGIMLFGDMPSYLLACRDKHELKMRTTIWAFLLGIMFGGDYFLNNIAGRICDASKLKTTLMNRKGFEKAGFFKKFLMDTHDLDYLNKMKNVSKTTKKAALVMYWGNFALTTALMGFTLAAIVNRQMKKDVKKDLKQQKIK